jgi:cell division protein FtsW
VAITKRRDSGALRNTAGWRQTSRSGSIAGRNTTIADRPAAADAQSGRGLLGPTPYRRVRPLRSARLLRGPTQAVMATRQALEPAGEVGLVGAKPVPEVRPQPLAFAVPRIDMFLLSTVVCLLMLGTVFVYSASMYQSYLTYGDVNYYMTKQIAWVCLGALALYLGLHFDYHQLRRFSMLGLGLTAVLLAMVHVSKFSYSANGATRWIYFKGFTLQPSEIGKLALTIYAAHWLSSKNDDVKHSWQGLLPFGAVLGFTTLLIFEQPDLGTAAVISGAMLGMFFVSGARLRHLVSLAALFLPVAYFVAHHGGYWSRRIDAWRHPFVDTQGTGYQISRALLAFWHGGLTGVGLGNGQLKESIPAPMTDSIFATIGEETGLLGALAVVALFAYFAYRGIRISILAKDDFGKLLAAGITTYLVFQALENMLSVTNIIPFTGVPLPFISFGGSSLVVNLVAVGILLNISRHLEEVPEERRDLAGTYLWWRNRRPHLSLPNRRAKPDSRPGTTWRDSHR